MSTLTLNLSVLLLVLTLLLLPGFCAVLGAHEWSQVAGYFLYLLTIPVWYLAMPVYAFWRVDRHLADLERDTHAAEQLRRTAHRQDVVTGDAKNGGLISRTVEEWRGLASPRQQQQQQFALADDKVSPTDGLRKRTAK